MESKEFFERSARSGVELASTNGASRVKGESQVV